MTILEAISVAFLLRFCYDFAAILQTFWKHSETILEAIFATIFATILQPFCDHVANDFGFWQLFGSIVGTISGAILEPFCNHSGQLLAALEAQSEAARVFIIHSM